LAERPLAGFCDIDNHANFFAPAKRDPHAQTNVYGGRSRNDIFKQAMQREIEGDGDNRHK
jgi:hypothetical protein